MYCFTVWWPLHTLSWVKFLSIIYWSYVQCVKPQWISVRMKCAVVELAKLWFKHVIFQLTAPVEYTPIVPYISFESAYPISHNTFVWPVTLSSSMWSLGYIPCIILCYTLKHFVHCSTHFEHGHAGENSPKYTKVLPYQNQPVIHSFTVAVAILSCQCLSSGYDYNHLCPSRPTAKFNSACIKDIGAILTV